ncbi:hypothetical protein AVEN_119407-1 [Araneus ventricosus]|uniref:Uncharacterized protein n=1 Tax=Araneus ventricosus TaxID=182803 RepID=A0A4Y2UFC1_ARAVE|nr:hypothetical protein AVEN_119407-1 [Araneus ventricosus]
MTRTTLALAPPLQTSSPQPRLSIPVDCNPYGGIDRAETSTVTLSASQNAAAPGRSVLVPSGLRKPGCDLRPKITSRLLLFGEFVGGLLPWEIVGLETSQHRLGIDGKKKNSHFQNFFVVLIKSNRPKTLEINVPDRVWFCLIDSAQFTPRDYFARNGCFFCSRPTRLTVRRRAAEKMDSEFLVEFNYVNVSIEVARGLFQEKSRYFQLWSVEEADIFACTSLSIFALIAAEGC